MVRWFGSSLYTMSGVWYMKICVKRASCVLLLLAFRAACTLMYLLRARRRFPPHRRPPLQGRRRCAPAPANLLLREPRSHRRLPLPTPAPAPALSLLLHGSCRRRRRRRSPSALERPWGRASAAFQADPLIPGPRRRFFASSTPALAPSTVPLPAATAPALAPSTPPITPPTPAAPPVPPTPRTLLPLLRAARPWCH